MGYTHYWQKLQALDRVEFAAFSNDARSLAYACEIPIAYEYDQAEHPPIFTDSEIRFNGVADNGCETFSVTADQEDFDFCKTAREPYDVLVCAVLIAFKHRFGELVEVSSDGSWDGYTYTVERPFGGNQTYRQTEWEDGRHLYRRVFPDRDADTSILKGDTQ